MVYKDLGKKIGNEIDLNDYCNKIIINKPVINYIDNKLSSNKAERKKSNINKFLRLPQIKIKHLNYAGW